MHKRPEGHFRIDPPGEGHGKGLDGDRLEVEDAWVEVDGAERAGGDDHALEFGEHWLHGQASIQAAQLRAATRLMGVIQAGGKG